MNDGLMTPLEALRARLAEGVIGFTTKGNEGRRKLMEYCAPNARTDTCKHCAFVGHTLVNTGSWNEREDLHCRVGGFPVRAAGICEHWERAK